MFSFDYFPVLGFQFALLGFAFLGELELVVLFKLLGHLGEGADVVCLDFLMEGLNKIIGYNNITIGSIEYSLQDNMELIEDKLTLYTVHL